MSESFLKNEMLWGEEFQNFLSQKHILVVGLGGVGGYALEMLARAGFEKFTLVDFDNVSTSNLNRQVIALNSTIGEKKTDLFEKRLKDINPNVEIRKFCQFYSKELNEKIFDKKIDFVVDAIDTMRQKVELLKTAKELEIPIISSFGAANRLNPQQLYISDISEIRKKCSFVKNLLYYLKKEGITQGIACVASEEDTMKVEKKEVVETLKDANGDELTFKKISPASCCFVTSSAGILMAYHIVKFYFGKF